MTYAQSLSADAIYILSAKHGLLMPGAQIDPYDQTLSKMQVEEVRMWGHRVLKQLRALSGLSTDRFTVLASERYRRYLLPHLTHFEVPMRGLRIGQQLKFLKEHLK